MVEASEVLERVPRPSDVQEPRRAVLEQKIEPAVAKRQTCTVLLVILAATAADVSGFGLRRRLGRARPQADEPARLQIEIARLELRKLQHDCTRRRSRSIGPVMAGTPPRCRATASARYQSHGCRRRKPRRPAMP